LTVPSISNANYGSVLDGSPFYSTNDQALYILKNNEAGGSTNMDLTGNLEGRSVTKLTIDQLNGSVNVTGSVIVSQNISASGNISASNLELQGNANIKGNITLGGNINIGNQDSDLIVFGGEVSSSILPELDNQFDLGAPTQNWRNLYVSGTAYIDEARISNMQINGVIVFEDLIVSGNTYLGNDLNDVTALSGSLKIKGDTIQTGSISLQGSQTIENNLTVQGGTINVAAAATDIEIKDNTSTALTISEGSNNYVVLNTTDNSEKITLGNTTTQIDNVIVDNKANAFTLKEGSNSYLDIATTNGSELITLGNTITSIANEVEDNAANAFKVAQSSNTYINVATTDSAEKVTIGNTLTSIDNVIEDNVSNAFTIKEGSNPYITIDTTNGSEAIKLETAGNVSVTGITTISNSTQNSTHNDGALVVTGGVGIGKNLYVSGSTTIAGNLTVLGSATQVIISASTVEIDDNILRLNAYSPFQRYAGIEVMDSGSNNVSASLLWDSTSDYWLFTSASGETGKAITTTFGTQGSEVSLAINTVPKATGLNAIGNSLITDNGTSFAYNTDALIVTGSSGQTYIKGKVTLANAGGTDLESNSSAMLFRNSSNELGYVSTTATTNVLTGILGYRESDGVLEFSSKIDGGFF
jgi:hypothetical protein